MFYRMKHLFRLAFACTIAAISYAETMNAAEWTTITGQIVLPQGDKIPVMDPIVPNVNVAACNKNGAFGDESFIVNPKNRGIQNVVVSLVPLGQVKGAPFPVADIHPNLLKSAKANVDIDQPCCSFIPHVLAMRDDQSLTIKNSATIPHNAKVSGQVNINPLIPAGGFILVPKIPADVFPNNLNCSIHGWMKAYIYVFDHPYFSVTDADGKFEIKDAPVGKFNLVLWQETAGWSKNGKRQGQPIPLVAGKTALPPIDFLLK